jgi:hypothetical protein
MTDVAKGLNLKGGTNTHRFQSKADRIALQSVNVTRKVRRREGEDQVVPDGGEEGSFFMDELENWKDLSPTLSFLRFYSEVRDQALTMALLLHHSSGIIGTLLRHLTAPNAPHVAPLLALLGTLARDLRTAFMPSFDAALAALLQLVEAGSGSPERVGDVFRTIGMLFKHLAKPLRASPAALRAYYAPMMGHRQAFVRRFAAETVAPLLRKLTDAQLHKHVRGLLRAAGNSSSSSSSAVVKAAAVGEGGGGEGGGGEGGDDGFGAGEDVAGAIERAASGPLADGLGQLLFQLARGVQHTLHSRGHALLCALLAALRPVVKKDQAGDEGQDGAGVGAKKAKKAPKKKPKKQPHDEVVVRRASAMAFAAVRNCLLHLAEFMRAPQTDEVWTELYSQTRGSVEGWQQAAAAAERGDGGGGGGGGALRAWNTHLCFTVSLLHLWTSHRWGTRVGPAQPPRLLAMLQSLLAPQVYHHGAVGVQLRRAIASLTAAAIGPQWRGPLLQTGSQSAQASAIALMEASLEVGSNVRVGDAPAHVACAVRQCHTLLDAFTGEQVGVPAAQRVSSRLALATGLFPPLVRFCTRMFEGDTHIASTAFVLLADVAAATRPVVAEFGASALPGVARGLLQVAPGSAGAKLLLERLRSSSMASGGAALAAAGGAGSGDAAQSWCALRCVQHVDVGADTAAWVAAVGKLTDAVEQALLGPPQKGGKKAKSKKQQQQQQQQQAAEAVVGGVGSAGHLETLLGQCCATLAALLCRNAAGKARDAQIVALCERVAALLRRSPACVPLLEAAEECLGELQGAAAAAAAAGPALETWAEAIEGNFCARSRLVRRVSVRILASFPALLWDPARDGKAPVACNALEQCAVMSELEATLDTERDFSRRLQMLEVMARGGQLPLVYVRLLARFALGLLHVRFQTIWAPAASLVAALTERHADVVWPIVEAQLRAVDRDLEQGGRQPDGGVAAAAAYSGELAAAAAAAAARYESSGDALACERFDRAVATVAADVAAHSTKFDIFHDELWKMLRLGGMPHVVGSHSTGVVGLFFRFLRCQYFVVSLVVVRVFARSLAALLRARRAAAAPLRRRYL